METSIVSSLREQGKAILVMMALAILTVLAMIVLNQFSTVVGGIPGLGWGNVSSVNRTIQTTITLFNAAFALFGSFAAITALVILVKAIIGVVRGLN